MLTIFKNLLLPLSKRELSKLFRETKETVFVEDRVAPTEKQFTAAQLWKIQGMKKEVRLKRH